LKSFACACDSPNNRESIVGNARLIDDEDKVLFGDHKRENFSGKI